jgi:hypothetical protein
MVRFEMGIGKFPLLTQNASVACDPLGFLFNTYRISLSGGRVARALSFENRASYI